MTYYYIYASVTSVYISVVTLKLSYVTIIMEDHDMYFILKFAGDFFFHDSDDENKTVNIPKVSQYAEEIIPRFSDKTFKMHFRITPNTFEALLIKMCSIQNDNIIHVGNKPLPMEKQLMITL